VRRAHQPASGDGKWAFVRRTNVFDYKNGTPVSVIIQDVPSGNSFVEYIIGGTVRFYDKDGLPYGSDQLYALTGSTLSFTHSDGSAGVTTTVKTLTSDSLVTVQTSFAYGTPLVSTTQYLVRWK
jgi:hypothetical protein